ncbi:unnamed protein product [Ceutorhynchus assimilis]|uniref:Uncharacterized protein n=1 Tax=Ceutorhynchus assimilis TaxID=467358 RepID=A0A9N9MLZ8_9CUCU|nr:unnamed protein product [Ceutorhynchus assimilis]
MATTPSTIIVIIKDKVNFPLKMGVVVMKQLFTYGVRDIVVRNDKIVIHLCYSPKDTTLKKKFGALPIEYMRTRLENDEELKLFDKALKKFKFNLDENEIAIEQGPPILSIEQSLTTAAASSSEPKPQQSSSSSKKLSNNAFVFEDDEFLIN